MRLIAALIAAALLSGCASEPTTTPEPEPSLAAVIDATQTSEGEQIFDPPQLTIQAGQTITFVMKNSQPHTVDFVDAGPSEPHSGNLNPGDRHEVAFTDPGTYRYFCAYHSNTNNGERVGMAGVIMVQ